LSKIGLGTYLGDPSTIHDKLVYEAILQSCLTGGVNVLDTSINYRYMKAERTIGAAVADLVKTHGFNRSELFIASKGGYLTVIIYTFTRA
jgi:aryl-alcohol dehydrogenase-like predicted oxidoreductase